MPTTAAHEFHEQSTTAVHHAGMTVPDPGAAERVTATGTPLPDPFHAGERAIQQRLGVAERMRPWARKVVHSFMPEQHRAFYAQLPFVVAAARDAADRPWATLLTGLPGFASAPDAHRLRLAAAPTPGDALHGRLLPGAALGLLGMDPASRRRNRMNGRITDAANGGVEVRVDQSFGNCPQFITTRLITGHVRPAGHGPGTPVQGTTLDAAACGLIAASDTMFIASGQDEDGPAEVRGLDVSHRGGPRGFVRVLGPKQLVFPDYAGNNHFNTLGNLLLDPRAGITFVDFERGTLLQLSGRAHVLWDGPLVRSLPDARRAVVFDIDAVNRVPDMLPISWREPDAKRLQLRTLARTRESADVISLELAVADGSPLPAFRAGQHLPVYLPVGAGGNQLARTYSLSGPPDADTWRITVRLEPGGAVSQLLHAQAREGFELQAGMPAGDFVLAPRSAPLVFVSAGVGVTPLVSMLSEALAADPLRSVRFVYAARDAAHAPLLDEVRARIEVAANAGLTVVFSRAAGSRRLDGPGLVAMVPDQAEVYLCGPSGFVADLGEALAAWRPGLRWFSGSFG